MRKFYSMAMGNETLQTGTKRLFGRSYTVEIENQTLLKSYDKLVDRTSLLEGHLHHIQLISKNDKRSLVEILKDLESYVHDENQKSRLYRKQWYITYKPYIEELVRTEKSGDEVQTKDNNEDLTSPVPFTDGWLTKSFSYLSCYYFWNTNSKYLKGYTECKLELISIKRSKRY